MKNKFTYLTEKLRMAVYDLATGEVDARSRIAVAYYRFWHISIEDFPEDLRRDRAKIDRLLTRLGGREGYIIPENLSRMKNKTAARIAYLILGIYLQIQEGRG